MRDILIVEDGLHERERLKRLFTGAKFSIHSAESAEEAEKLLNIEQFRLAILDIGLGDKSGTYLFELMRRPGKIPYIIILTGNPSIHLKQRFLDEGAAAYIVKASAASENDSLLDTVRGFLGTAELSKSDGIPLADFLRLYLSESSRGLFFDSDSQIPACGNCGSHDFVVSFSHKTQLPPRVEGRVVCSGCGYEMNPEVG